MIKHRLMRSAALLAAGMALTVAGTAMAQTRQAPSGTAYVPAVPQPESSLAMSNAEKLHRLDIMMMVTGLRCRVTADDFQEDVGMMDLRHRPELAAARQTLRAQYARRVGAAGAQRALDHISVEMANDYGNGHPWLGCRDLRGLAQYLASTPGEGPLLAAANQVLAKGRPQRHL